MRAIKLATVFVCCMGVCALVAWLGGFNFDRRDFAFAIEDKLREKNA